MAKIDIDGDGKPDITLSLANIITIFVLFASIIGSYYTLNAKVEQAMEQPAQEVSAKDIEALEREFDLKLSKVIRQAEENMEDIKDIERNYKRK